MLRVVESSNTAFIVVDENVVYDNALEVALATAPSNFDAYFNSTIIFNSAYGGTWQLLI